MKFFQVIVLLFSLFLLISCSKKPETVQVSKDGGDFPSLEEAVKAVAPNSTINLDAGQYELAAPLHIEKPLIINGAGSDLTTITTSTGSATIAYEANGKLEINNLAVERSIGEFAGDVMLVIKGDVTLDNCRISGGSSSRDRTVGGAGMLIGGDSIAEITNCEITDNEGPAISIGQNARADITDNTIKYDQIGIFVSSDAPGSVVQDNKLVQGFTGLSAIMVMGSVAPDFIGNTCSGGFYFENTRFPGVDRSGIQLIATGDDQLPNPIIRENSCAVARCYGASMLSLNCW